MTSLQTGYVSQLEILPVSEGTSCVSVVVKTSLVLYCDTNLQNEAIAFTALGIRH